MLQQRKGITRLMEENPSLRPAFETLVAQAYPDAAQLAALVIGLFPGAFPAQCPYSIQRLLDENFLP